MADNDDMWLAANALKEGEVKLTEVLVMQFLVNINHDIYAGVLELVYINDLESLAERIKGSTPFACTTGLEN